MKLKISCQKCKSTNVIIASNIKDSTPMYKCNDCNYQNNLFPQFENKDKLK